MVKKHTIVLSDVIVLFLVGQLRLTLCDHMDCSPPDMILVLISESKINTAIIAYVR